MNPHLDPSRHVGHARTLDVVGATMFAGFAGWILLVGAWTGGDPWPMASLVVAVGVTMFAARSATRRWNTLVPGSMLVLLLLWILLTWPAAIHPDFGLTGYQTADGALHVIGVGAAGLLMLRARTGHMRLAAGVAGTALTLLAWLLPSDVASVSALLSLVMAGWLLQAHGEALLSVLPHGVLIVALVLLATTALGIFYDGDGRGDGGWRLTERRLVLWSDSVEMVVARPMNGVGPGAFSEHSFAAQRDPDAPWAHHAPLQVGAETGLPGLLLLLGLLGWTYMWLARGSGRRGGALAGLVLTLSILHASIDHIWHHPAVLLALAGVVGAGASAGRPKRVGSSWRHRDGVAPTRRSPSGP